MQFLGNVANALFLLASVYIYVALTRQIAARDEDDDAATRAFGLPEAILAGALILLFSFVAATSSSTEAVNMQTRDIVANFVFEIGLLAFVAVFLQLRRFNIANLAGLTKITFRRALITGFVLLLAAYPLIAVATLVTEHALGPNASRQGIIDLFSGSGDFRQRVLIIVLAVALAPIAEEFFFRFFLYGVLRKHLGRTVALLFTAALFAAVHAHIPSFAPLFVLAACFTIAYEWSGSLLVSMTMHSVFNGLTLAALAFPNALQR